MGTNLPNYNILACFKLEIKSKWHLKLKLPNTSYENTLHFTKSLKDDNIYIIFMDHKRTF